MATGLYDKGREDYLNGDISWRDDNIRVVLVDTDVYTPNLATDQFLSDIPSGADIATSALLSGKSSAAGVADADDAVFTGVSGSQFEACVIYADTGVPGTSRLIAYIDNATGLPFTPSGSDLILRWNNGPNKIYKL